MDWFPLYNSLRIAAVSTAAVFFLGIFAARTAGKLPRLQSTVPSRIWAVTSLTLDP